LRWRDWVWMHTRPPFDRFRDRKGICNVCGQRSRFLYNRWALPSGMAKDIEQEQVREAYRSRESMWCSHCGASTRERGYWSVLIDHFAATARSASSLVKEPAFRALQVAEINRQNAGHVFLAELPGLTYSEFPEEDIQALSFADGTFDLVLTSETLEHVPDFRKSLRETLRVLRPGGRHVLTVPLRPDLAVSRSREGLEAVFHGVPPGPWSLVRRPGEDMRCLHDFALDFQSEITAAGFDLEVHGTGIEIVFCARRPRR
jgi:SAM-dependent methyltransferase